MKNQTLLTEHLKKQVLTPQPPPLNIPSPLQNTFVQSINPPINYNPINVPINRVSQSPSPSN